MRAPHKVAILLAVGAAGIVPQIASAHNVAGTIDCNVVESKFTNFPDKNNVVDYTFNGVSATFPFTGRSGVLDLPTGQDGHYTLSVGWNTNGAVRATFTLIDKTLTACNPTPAPTPPAPPAPPNPPAPPITPTPPIPPRPPRPFICLRTPSGKFANWAHQPKVGRFRFDKVNGLWYIRQVRTSTGIYKTVNCSPPPAPRPPFHPPPPVAGSWQG